MKTELQALIRALEADAFNISAEGHSLRSGLLARAHALDTLDEEQLSRIVGMVHEDLTLESQRLGEDAQLAAQVLALIGGDTVDEDEEEGL